MKNRFSKNKSYYSISMFPYPSGDIHMGHFRNFCAQDFFNRYQLMNGREVLSFLGWDAFGLPAENAAIERKISPKKWTEDNISSMNEVIGLFKNYYTKSKEVVTCRPEYYLHQQKIFMWLYEAGLFYKKKSIVNWDPVDQTVLANEQVHDGKGWRSGAIVEKKEMNQWFFKITNYAEELLTKINDLDWPDRIKNAQIKWIGKSIGYEIEFPVIESNFVIKVFTTRPETINGVKFIALSPFSEYASLLKNNKDLIVLNKYNNTKIPVLFADYVLDYGTGAVMGVPNDDERDRNFAILNNISSTSYEKNHSILNELNVKINYRLRDWCIERQRSWGCPIPIIYCDNCGIVLSLKPFLIEDPLHITCHKCNNKAKRETSTMDTFVDSSWYFLRYLCSDNDKEPFDNRVRPVDLYIGGAEHATLHLIYARAFVKALRDLGKLNFDEPFITLINQGMVLADAFVDNNNKPVDLRLVDKNNDGTWINKQNGQQVFFKENAKMSKSLKNVISPKEILEQYGVDSCRLFIASNPLIVDMAWNTRELNGCKKFLHQLENMCDYLGKNCKDARSYDDDLYTITYKLQKDFIFNMNDFKTNCAIAKIRTHFNVLSERMRDREKSRTFVWSFGKLLVNLWSICPDLCDKLYFNLFSSDITEQRNCIDMIELSKKTQKIQVYIDEIYKKTIEVEMTDDMKNNIINYMKIDENLYEIIYKKESNLIKFTQKAKKKLI